MEQKGVISFIHCFLLHSKIVSACCCPLKKMFFYENEDARHTVNPGIFYFPRDMAF